VNLVLVISSGLVIVISSRLVISKISKHFLGFLGIITKIGPILLAFAPLKVITYWADVLSVFCLHHCPKIRQCK
jgi:hypothetical protein